MRKIIAVVLMLVIVCFSACSSDPQNEPETGTDIVVDADKVYESMLDAANSGQYGDAIEYYNSGAAGAEDPDVIDWYFYSMAMQENTENGCIGYPLDLLMNNANEDFAPSKTKIDEWLTLASPLNGVYEKTGIYLYIDDGKIAASAGKQLSETYFCNSEIVYKDETYFFAERGLDGTHKLLYTIEKIDGGVRLTATQENENDIYSGDYLQYTADLPIMKY